MKVNWADEARADLRDILIYLYKTFGSKVTRRALADLKWSIQLLLLFPSLGKPCIEAASFGISYRMLSSKHHKLVYYLENDTLNIVAVWDNRKDPERLRNRMNGKKKRNNE